MNDDQSELPSEPPDPQGPGSLDDLGARLKQARQDQDTKTGRSISDKVRAPASGFGQAFRIGTELVAALIIGVGAGYLLDQWLETTPWMMVIFFFLGAAAGILNVYRAAAQMGLAGNNSQTAPTGNTVGDAGQDNNGDRP
ncbi:MAG: AtpZ/AtpI family protein [Rhodospirillales bacterium]|nr:AtpZ/AtpI family protein [Rhodospirillales bacterium]